MATGTREAVGLACGESPGQLLLTRASASQAALLRGFLNTRRPRSEAQAAPPLQTRAQLPTGPASATFRASSSRSPKAKPLPLALGGPGGPCYSRFPPRALLLPPWETWQLRDVRCVGFCLSPGFAHRHGLSDMPSRRPHGRSGHAFSRQHPRSGAAGGGRQGMLPAPQPQSRHRHSDLPGGPLPRALTRCL